MDHLCAKRLAICTGHYSLFSMSGAGHLQNFGVGKTTEHCPVNFSLLKNVHGKTASGEELGLVDSSQSRYSYSLPSLSIIKNLLIGTKANLFRRLVVTNEMLFPALWRLNVNVEFEYGK